MTDILGPARDPQFPNYAYAAKQLVQVYKNRTGRPVVAKVFLGEWMKLLDKVIPSAGRLHVKYRGGEGWVEPDQLSRQRHLEIFFIDVNKGDGILIQTPDDRRILVDAGQSDDTLAFIRNKYRLDAPDNYIDFDAVVATHSDADHSQGLLNILADPKIAVKRFYHNGLFHRADKGQSPGPHKNDRVFGLVDRPGPTDIPPLTPLMKKLAGAVSKAEKNLPVIIKKMQDLKRRVDVPEEGFVCKRLDAADRFLPPFDKTDKPLVIEVLWPRATILDGKSSYPWFENPGKTVNGNSVVLNIRHGDQQVLLTGDLNTEAMDTLIDTNHGLAERPPELKTRVYKAAHHGSQDFSLSFLQAVKPDAAVISSGDDKNDQHGHPRAVLLGTITRYSNCDKPAVFSTELAACFTLLSPKEQSLFKSGRSQIYERSIQGIVHLRSSGSELYLGCVHGRKAPDDPLANVLWKWDVWPEVEKEKEEE